MCENPFQNRAALGGILFVLCGGIPWEMLPREMGCGSGVPLGVVLTGANIHDSVPFAAVIDAVPPIRGRRGRPRRRHQTLHADKAADHAR